MNCCEISRWPRRYWRWVGFSTSKTDNNIWFDLVVGIDKESTKNALKKCLYWPFECHWKLIGVDNNVAKCGFVLRIVLRINERCILKVMMGMYEIKMKLAPVSLFISHTSYIKINLFVVLAHPVCEYHKFNSRNLTNQLKAKSYNCRTRTAQWKSWTILWFRCEMFCVWVSVSVTLSFVQMVAWLLCMHTRADDSLLPCVCS